MQSDEAHYECIYIRPANGRVQDQLRRNHSTEYESLPDWPWYRLRKESPGVYESYADMAEGEWIHMRIVVHGAEAALYLHHAAQPCLLIHELKLGDKRGAIALWGGRIVVHGAEAALYLHYAAQPCLLIHELKLGDKRGAIALWGGTGTVGYFANLSIVGDDR